MYAFSRNQRTGLNGEQWLVDKLTDMGYDVKFDPDFYREGYDCLVNGLPTEIKTANPTRRKRKWKNRIGVVFENWYDRWQFHIHPTSHRLTDWLLILIADDGQQKYVYIVPGGVVLDRTHIQITSHPTKYNGWLAQFLNQWQMIDYLANGVYRNGGPLFHEWSERMAV